MKNIIFVFILLFSFVGAKEIYPTFKLKSNGLVNDFAVNDNIIYIASDVGTVEVFDLNSGELVHQISLDLIINVMGDTITPNILSVDYLNGKLLIVSTDVSSYRNVWLYKDFELTKIMGKEKKLTVKEARFTNDETIILGTFSSEIILHDIAESYKLYTRHVTQSTLGDIALNEDKTKVAMSDESGEIRLLDVATSKILKVYSSQNVDNVYHVAYAQGVIITAGQDRRVAVYQNGVKDYHIKSDFLVYCVGISPSGKVGVYAKGEQSDLQLFDTKTQKELDTLVGHKGIINQIKFINEKELFSNERSPYVYYWRLD